MNEPNAVISNGTSPLKVARAQLLEEGYARLFSLPGHVVYGHTAWPSRYATIASTGAVKYRLASEMDEFIRNA